MIVQIEADCIFLIPKRDIKLESEFVDYGAGSWAERREA